VGFDDIVEDLDIGLMGTIELRRGNWLLMLDGLYMKLQDDKSRSWTGPGGLATATADLEATPELSVIGIAGGYRIEADNIAVDVLGGARYTKVEMKFELTATTVGLFPGGVRTVSADESWWDPFVGVRIVVPFAEKWSGVLYADYGGFGVGSDVTYQVLAGVNWIFSKHFSAKVGYRYLYQDFEDDDNGFVWDMKAYGPYLGLGIRF
jgi:opacity protein-like surface antigen